MTAPVCQCLGSGRYCGFHGPGACECSGTDCPACLRRSDLELRAEAFAALAHEGQVRKYTGEPYVHHPAAVAGIVRTVPHTEAQLAAAWLHDTVEDTDATLDQVRDAFGDEVAELVEQLTDISKPEDGNRASRKRLDREHLAKASPAAKTVKLADLIDNSRSIVERDPDFAKVYLAEKRLLLEVLRGGDPTLWAEASRVAEGGAP